MYCLIDIQEEEAMQFLKDAEGANHTKWIIQNIKNYKPIDKTI